MKKKTNLCIPRHGGQNVACWCLHLWSLWTAFICCCLLQSEVVNPCFIHCHIFMQKLLFVALKQLQTLLWIINALLFLIEWGQMQHPLWTQLSYWQKFMQNGEYAAFWYLQLPLSHTTSIYDWPKWVCGVFWCFLGQLSIQHHLCLYYCVYSQRTTS